MIKVGQIWRVKQYSGKFVFLLITDIISRVDPNWNTKDTGEKYCRVVNIENNSEYKDWIFPNEYELINEFIS